MSLKREFSGLSRYFVVSTATLRLGSSKSNTPFFPALIVRFLLSTIFAPPTAFMALASAVNMVRSAVAPRPTPSKVSDTGTAAVELYTAALKMRDWVWLLIPAA